MKTLENLKTFCLDKKQMNAVTGGQTPCDVLANLIKQSQDETRLEELNSLFAAQCA